MIIRLNADEADALERLRVALGERSPTSTIRRVIAAPVARVVAALADTPVLVTMPRSRLAYCRSCRAGYFEDDALEPTPCACGAARVWGAPLVGAATAREDVAPPGPAIMCLAVRNGGKHDGDCCERAGEYNGFGSDGPTSFTCPRSCPCHD